ncbi:SpoIIE family protein phosphatase [Flammeovirgaceae bacterium SG7u.111]|nr:SpoIIE family protein phosphatase [Flammeovirgaceae bacterium SG7u.132]WPO38076.1 SpoIIE family protein phosphatase [Flammeovirgaceae bacterium SG7u.111]
MCIIYMRPNTIMNPINIKLIIKHSFLILLLFLLVTQTRKVFSQDLASVNGLIEKAKSLKGNGKSDELNQVLIKLTQALYNDGKYNDAILYYGEMIELNKEIGNDNAIAFGYSQIANIHAEQGDLPQSIASYETAIAIRRKMRDNQGLSSLLLTLGIAQKESGQMEAAIKNLEEALELSRSLSNKYAVTDCQRSLAEVYEKLGDGEKALFYQKQYTDSYKIEEITARQELEEEFNAEKQQKDAKISKINSQLENTANVKDQALEIALAKAKEVELLEEKRKLQEMAMREQDARIESNNMMINAFIGGGSLVLILSVMLGVGYVQILKAKKNLSFKNEEILTQSIKLKSAFGDIKSSINYAKKIQMAMMPSDKAMNSGFIESFVFLKPRDVVSGDFYWHSERNGKVIVAAVDCTGHGVPGAFMSMIGSNILNQIVNERGVTEPDKVLNMLNERVKKALNQDETRNKDGMDIALCVLDPKEKTVSYAGAKNPLVLVTGDEVKIIKGDNMSIGGTCLKGDCKFTEHVVNIDETTMCYIYSDGFQDQFGGAKKKKYMSVNFRNLLKKVSIEPLEKQNELLKKELIDWMQEGKEDQIDDVLVIGFKLEF